SEKLANEFRGERRDLQKFSVSYRIFLNNGALYETGETLRQPELAATLKRIAKHGAAEFYRGQTARMLIEDMRAQGGLLTMDDLAAYQAKARPVLRAKSGGNGPRWGGNAS